MFNIPWNRLRCATAFGFTPAIHAILLIQEAVATPPTKARCSLTKFEFRRHYRMTLIMLIDAYESETIKEGAGKETPRVVFRSFIQSLRGIGLCFPLARNTPDLVGRVRQIEHDLRQFARTQYDEGYVGRLYGRQGEIGTPYCVMGNY